jgi:hypothetical protein
MFNTLVHQQCYLYGAEFLKSSSPSVSSLSARVESLKVPLLRSKVHNRAHEQSEQLETLTYRSDMAAAVESCSQ